MDIERDITEFRQAFGLPVNDTPTLLEYESPGIIRWIKRKIFRKPISEAELHLKLIKEEFDETVQAYKDGDLTEVFDGIVDMIYVLGGLAVHMGLPLEEGWREVHSSNMSKLDENGEPIYREDGKVLKGSNYFPPRLDVLLEMASQKIEWFENE